jgi:hypothetical protein
VAAGPDATRSAPPVVAVALGSVGISVPAGAGQGQALAALGAKGAMAGQSLQQWSGGSAYVHVGPNADKRTLAAAIDSVRLTKVAP